MNTTPKTVIVYLIGRPGTGKYTISKELAKSGFLICDNQLINNSIFSVSGYDGFTEVSEYAWECIKKIRDVVFEYLEDKTEHSYILTNVLYEESQGDRDLYNQVKDLAQKRGSLFIPVRLTLNQEEHLRRITNPSRKERFKTIDPQEMHHDKEILVIADTNALEIDVSFLSAAEVSALIVNHIKSVAERTH